MTRILVSVLLSIFVAGCQTGTDTDGALKSVAPSKTAAISTDPEMSPEVVETGSVPAVTPPIETAKVEPVKIPNKPVAAKASSGDVVQDGVIEIAKIRKSKGERAAVESVFACYKSARAKSASLQAAQICAAQDFALSRDIIARRPANATGSGDRALLVSKRHAARIGALLQFKGMGQGQFNTFGKYLHVVAEPAYKKAISS